MNPQEQNKRKTPYSPANTSGTDKNNPAKKPATTAAEYDKKDASCDDKKGSCGTK